jgi:hypothetical protein
MHAHYGNKKVLVHPLRFPCCFPLSLSVPFEHLKSVQLQFYFILFEKMQLLVIAIYVVIFALAADGLQQFNEKKLQSKKGIHDLILIIIHTFS